MYKSSRLDSVLKSIQVTGTYEHTVPELAFGAQLAWRNASRCIGRISWSNLQVLNLNAINDFPFFSLFPIQHDEQRQILLATPGMNEPYFNKSTQKDLGLKINLEHIGIIVLFNFSVRPRFIKTLKIRYWVSLWYIQWYFFIYVEYQGIPRRVIILWPTLSSHGRIKSREIVCLPLSLDAILMFYIIILQLMDCRGVKSNLEMFDAVCQHIKYATNGGILRYEIYSIIYDSSIWDMSQMIQGQGKLCGWNV